LIKALTIILLGISLNGFSQSNLDAAISDLKKLYAENVKRMDQKKIYFNKSERLIDVGLDGYQIPITAHIVYKLDTSFHPAENTLIFRWPSKISERLKKLFPDTEDGITIIFKSKDDCYDIIDTIEKIRKLFKSD
jgi:hypothetical protein